MSTCAPLLDQLRSEAFFQELCEAGARLRKRFVVYLVDHGPLSRSTHKFWWHHFAEACRILDIPCWQVPKDSRRWPREHLKHERRGIYLFFTAQSLYYRRPHLVRAIRPEAIRPDDVVASWDVNVIRSFPHAQTFQIAFRSPLWLANRVQVDHRRVLIWEPYAPFAALRAGLLNEPNAKIRWDFVYFGTLNPHNYDHFRAILRPLALHYRCRYIGKVWRIFSLEPFRYGFSPFLVSDLYGIDNLCQGRVNLVLHNDYHRQLRSVTERLFISAAVGRPVVCDNVGAWQYFSPAEVPVAEDPTLFLALCTHVLETLPAREEIAREVQRKVLRRYTYLHTVIRLLEDIDRKLAQGSMADSVAHQRDATVAPGDFAHGEGMNT
ncbi:MAG: glycosyltransferase [candidate division KSB1 bacterium]|nr:glycosyltransferase [candidate division KSB1 bacterium]